MAVATSRDDGQADGAQRSTAAAEQLLLEVVQAHGPELLRLARRHSICADDAQDAYQRSLELFLRHARRLERASAHSWLFTVCRREALAVRAEALHLGELDPERTEARHDPSPEERALAGEAIDRSADALVGLKPQELRALWLRADGRSYAEIQELTGWSYTKVNRCLREGRQRYQRHCAEHESGAGCARWSAALRDAAGGAASAAVLVELRPHLRRCAACRATLRALHAEHAAATAAERAAAPSTTPRATGANAPAAAVGVGAAGFGAGEGPGGRLEAACRWLGRLPEALLHGIHERAATGALQLQSVAEAAGSQKVAALAASTVALAGGSAAVVEHRALPAHPAHHRSAPRAPTAGAHRLALPPTTSRVAAPATPVPATRAEPGAAAARGPQLLGVGTNPDGAGAPARSGSSGRPAAPAAPAAEFSREAGAEPSGTAATRRRSATAATAPRGTAVPASAANAPTPGGGPTSEWSPERSASPEASTPARGEFGP